MTASDTQHPVVLRRIQLSTAAWQLLCEATSTILDLPATNSAGQAAAPGTEFLQLGSAQPAPLSGDAEAAAWSELKELGMSPAACEVALQWMGAVSILLTAPITVTARATYNGVSTTSVLGLRAGRGLAVHQRHISEVHGQDSVVVGSEDSMEVTLFDMDNVWGATARLLPPLDVVQAASLAAPLPAGAATSPGLSSYGPAEDANVALSVVTAAEGRPSRVWAGKWSVRGGQLYSVPTDGDASPAHVTPVPSGHIAHELVAAVVVAHAALPVAANTAGGPAREGGGK
ncbi:hypothetical protein [Arthrobacter sp.]|uniref:hypothetical protein n=1 Tax=Arthrobacter sp. TaxID=1667 RepID=UPI0026E03911|nr:hypothetical protein [Arthrobacter sp.]MDO5752763.1 hypothetical protein [Arthrobacter sp.]